jgi:hypothetical protein
MNKRTTFIAGAAFVIAGTAGMASWLSVEADEIQPASQAQSASQPGLAETEGLVAAPQPPAAPQPLIAERPVLYAPLMSAPARVERAARTPVAAAPAEPIRSAQAEPEPSNAEPRTEPVEPVEPRNVEPKFIEVHLPAGTVLGVRLSSSVSSENAELEDRVEAIVSRDVIADGHVAIPSGTRVLGSVNEVTRGGKFKERARLGIRFHTLVLADGTRQAVRVDGIVREGDSPVRESTAKIGGGAIGGAIIGGIMGGKKGALLGGVAGAGAGTAAVAASDRSIAAIASGTPLSVRLDAPVTVTIEKD